MTKFAKLNGDKLEYAPTRIVKDGFTINNPSDDLLLELGYKPLVYDELKLLSGTTTLREVFSDMGDYIKVSYKEIVIENFTGPSILDLITFAKIIINNMNLDDNQSIIVKNLYPEWSEFVGKGLKQGTKILYKGSLYKTTQDISIVTEDQYPSEVCSLHYEKIEE